MPALLALASCHPLLRAATAPERVFSDLKIYTAGEQPWRVPREDWAGARQRVASDAKWAAWLKREQKGVDEWMATRRDRVEWVCGWFHDFVSPKNASRLTWTPQVPGEDVSFLSSPSDPHVEITPKIMAAWVYEFRSRHADMIERAARLYRLTGEERYASWAAGQLDFYAQNYLRWIPQRKEGARLFWQTLDEASNGIKYIDTVRLLEGYVAPDRKQRWWTDFFRPEADVLTKDRQHVHNIALWLRSAVAQFALVYHDDALWRDAIDGKFGVREQIAKGVTADYLWFEQSFHYNEFAVEAVLPLFIQAGLAGRSAELAHEMAVTENLMLSPLYVRFPNGQLPNPADGTGIETVPHRAFLASTYRVFPTSVGLSEAAGLRDWKTLVDPPAPPSGSETLPPVRSQNLESSRMALLKRGPWQVFVHYGQIVASHAQSEALNFSAFYHDTDITHDPGTVGYGSPFHQEYYTKGLNHNVPLVNGEGQKPPQPGQLVQFSEETGTISVAQPEYRPDAAAERTLVIDGDRLVDTTTIRCKTETPQALGLALHVQGKLRRPPRFTPAPTFADGRPAAFRYWHDVASADYVDKAEFEVDYGARRIRITLAVPGAFTVWHGSTPDVPPLRREGIYVETHGTSATFTTTFAPIAP